MPESAQRRHLNVGGQAVIEGVMMRSPDRIATAVRTPSGRIVVKEEDYKSLTSRHRVLSIPVVRGAVVFVETLILAFKALSFSAEKATEEDQAEVEEKNEGVVSEVQADKGAPSDGSLDAVSIAREDADAWDSSKGGGKKSGGAVSALNMAVLILFSLGLGFALFFYLPLFITERLNLENGFVFNLVDGSIRLLILIIYILAMTRWKEMQRIFEYHGAEHKTIFALEQEGVVSAEAARKYPTVHPRCSTSFLLLVVFVSLVVFSILGKPSSVGDRVVRFAFIPVIGGLAYELLKLSAKERFGRYFSIFVKPGLLLQRFTTKEPSEDQLEVAAAALKACLENGKS